LRLRRQAWPWCPSEAAVLFGCPHRRDTAIISQEQIYAHHSDGPALDRARCMAPEIRRFANGPDNKNWDELHWEK
jgi:hypothetical protein